MNFTTYDGRLNLKLYYHDDLPVIICYLNCYLLILSIYLFIIYLFKINVVYLYHYYRLLLLLFVNYNDANIESISMAI